MSGQRFRVFTRTWWTANKDWPNGLEPGAGPRSYRGHPKGLSEAAARDYCQVWNACHPPGRLSRKAEFESY
jgi:hypothetical protein